VFLDTNVLLYAAMAGRVEPAKKARAREIVLQEDYGTSAQVLAEFYTNATKKGSKPLVGSVAAEWVRQISRKPCEPVTPDLVLDGIAHSQRYQISCWDGAIIAAAERLGAKTLYSEDLNHGQTYGSITVVNPFIGI
jgi:predicted nucleic acid-binding protein